MRLRHLTLAVVFALTACVLPDVAHAELKLATLNVKGMVCQA